LPRGLTAEARRPQEALTAEARRPQEALTAEARRPQEALTAEARRLQEERSESRGRKPRLNEVNHEDIGVRAAMNTGL